MSVKGSWQRPDTDRSKFESEYDRIFNKNTSEDYGDVDDSEQNRNSQSESQDIHNQVEPKT
jgi:hypothetical protein